MNQSTDQPYITPEKLLGKKSLPIECKLAFICYCPMPIFFEKCDMKIKLTDRYFIHTHNSHIMFCEYNGLKFIVVAEVYGGPVSVTTVEELHYYGINTIIGIGFVGSLDKDLTVGSTIVAQKSLIECGTTPHYPSHEGFYVDRSMKLSMDKIIDRIHNVTVWTTNALYREYPQDVKYAKEMGCSVVNMDTSHLYAATRLLKISCEYYGVVSDVINDGTDKEDVWKNDLIQAVNLDNSIVITAQSDLIRKILDK